MVEIEKERRRLVVGVRSYLVERNLADSEKQLAEIREAFPNAELVLASCGLQPTGKMRSLASQCVHYSSVPLGLGIPNKLLFEKAAELNATELVIIDGDMQHVPANVARLLDEAKTKNKPDFVLPRRKKRILFTREELHGPTVEDLLNAFLRREKNCVFSDLVPGAYLFLNPGVFSRFVFSKKHSWVGDTELVKNALDLGLKISTPELEVRAVKDTISDRTLVFNSLEHSEDYFKTSVRAVVDFMKKNPESCFFGGNFYELDKTVEAYSLFKAQERIKKMKALVLAGGVGTRLRPFTHTIQKQLFPIANKPILHYIIEKIVESGIREIGVVVGPNKEQVKASLGDGSAWNCKITYIEQDRPGGLAHAVVTARPFLQESSFLMYLGDNLLSADLNVFLQEFVESGFPASLMLTRVKNPSAFGIVELDEHGKIKRLLEKPKNPPSDLAIIGVYAFTREIHDAISKTKPSARGELEITDAIQKLCEQEKPLNYRIVTGWWEDTGSVESLLDANMLVLKFLKPFNEGFVDDSCVVKGDVQIGEGTRVESGSTIVGPVSIGKNCVISAGALIGPYTTIGDDCVVKEAELFDCLLLSKTSVSGPARLAFSILGRNCKVVCSTPQSKRMNLAIGDDTNLSV